MPRQGDLFGTDEGGVQRFDLLDADVELHAAFFPPHDADRLLAALLETTAWHQATVKMYGEELPIPRLQAWYGDPGKTYSYSGIDLEPLPWTDALAEVKARIERGTGDAFNSVLANLYRDGDDSVGWHADDEPELGPAPVIASVSFGATRRFQLRHEATVGPEATLEPSESTRRNLDLTHGSLVVMRGPTQRHWKHQLAKTKAAVGPRVNLTFRTII